jgi:hypothetical protein
MWYFSFLYFFALMQKSNKKNQSRLWRDEWLRPFCLANATGPVGYFIDQ